MQRYLKTIGNKLGRLHSADSGVALLEFALLLPILIIILVGGIEISRLVLFHQKIDNATNRVADMITRLNLDVVPCGPGPGGLQWNHQTMLPQAMEPYNFDGVLIVSSVEATYANPAVPNDAAPLKQEVAWQWSSGGATSRIGNDGGLASGSGWPAGFRVSPDDGGMFDGDRIIAVEVFYQYEPLFPGSEMLVPMGDVIDVYKSAFYRGRFGNLADLGC